MEKVLGTELFAPEPTHNTCSCGTSMLRVVLEVETEESKKITLHSKRLFQTR